MSAAAATAEADSRALVAEAEALASRLSGVREAVGRIIFGQGSVVEQTLITLLSGGHALLVGVPGLGKTRLVETLGTVLGLAEQVGGDVGGHRGVVGQDRDLGRTGLAVDADDALDQALGADGEDAAQDPGR